MALYSTSYFTGFSDSYAVPAGGSDVIVTSIVALVLSTGITQQVFDTLSTALKKIHFKEQQQLYFPSQNEDAPIINLRCQLWVLKPTYINQKMLNSYVFTTHGNHVQPISRFMADMASLTDALSSVGFRFSGPPWSTDTNLEMETDRADKDKPRIQVADYAYKSPTLPHTNLQDSPPIVISGVYIFKKANINI